MIVQNSNSQAMPVASSLPVASAAPSAAARALAVAPATEAPAVEIPVQRPTPVENLTKAVAAVNDSLRRTGSALQFTIDRATEVAVVTMVDSNTGEVIRQIPSEEALAIAQSIDEMLQRVGPSCDSGILCKQTA